MTDTVKSWIEERRAIQRDGRGCTCQIDWRYPCPEHSPGNPVSQMVLADSVREFPRALDALNAVLELHHGERDEYGCWTCRFCSHIQQTQILYPCATVRAVESALKAAETGETMEESRT